MFYGNRHKGRCLDRFYLLEPRALPAVAALGLGTATAAGRCPKVPKGSRAGQGRAQPCLQPALLPSSCPKTTTRSSLPVPCCSHLPQPSFRNETRNPPSPRQLLQKLQHLGGAEGREPLCRAQSKWSCQNLLQLLQTWLKLHPGKCRAPTSPRSLLQKKPIHF